MWRSSRACAAASIAALVLVTRPCRADAPSPARAVLAGAAVFLAGFVVGGALMSTSRGHDEQTSAGWMAIQGGFALTPLVAHGAVGEWTRGLAFASVPAGALAGTAIVVGVVPDAIDQGQIAPRVSVWSFFTAGLLSAVAGVIDATVAERRFHAPPLSVAPIIGSERLGLTVGGTL